MRKRKGDLDRITSLLRQCLDRIDQQARLVQQLDGEVTDATAAPLFENEDTELQELVDSLLESWAAADQADLNRIVQQTVQAFLGETRIPVVVRERLSPDLPPAGCAPGQLACAVRRALVLALGRMEAGREILVATRADGDNVVLDVERHGEDHEGHLPERATTLCEFVAGLRGECRLGSDDGGSLRISFELPRAAPVDEY